MTDHRADVAFDKSIHTYRANGEKKKMRVETDNLGSLEIPADAYWGINVGRALDNFCHQWTSDFCLSRFYLWIRMREAGCGTCQCRNRSVG